MKAIVVGIVLCAAIAGPAAFAKPAHSHHVRRAGANPAQSRHSATAPDKATIGKSPGESGDVPLPESSRQERDNSHAIKPSLKIVTPDISPANRNKFSEPPNLSIRNALGQPVEPMAGRTREAVHFQSENRPQGISSVGAPEAALGGSLAIKNTNDRSSGMPSVPHRGAIGGTGMIRRNVASSIGGPAKPAGGINGTLIRPKHP